MLRLWYANCKKHGHPVLDPGNSSKTGSCRCLFTTITLRTIARVTPNCAALIRHRTGRATTRRILPAMSKPKDSTARFSNCRRLEEYTSELQSLRHLVCRLLLEKK